MEFRFEKPCPRCNAWGTIQPDGTPFPNDPYPYVPSGPSINCPMCDGKRVFVLYPKPSELDIDVSEDEGITDLRKVADATGSDIDEAINLEFLRQLREKGYGWD